MFVHSIAPLMKQNWCMYVYETLFQSVLPLSLRIPKLWTQTKIKVFKKFSCYQSCYLKSRDFPKQNTLKSWCAAQHKNRTKWHKEKVFVREFGENCRQWEMIVFLAKRHHYPQSTRFTQFVDIKAHSLRLSLTETQSSFYIKGH